jgi:hypothetical protein
LGGFIKIHGAERFVEEEMFGCLGCLWGVVIVMCRCQVPTRMRGRCVCRDRHVAYRVEVVWGSSWVVMGTVKND